MKLDPHEDKMRNKLSSQRINVDTDQLWSKLEAFVPEQKPRRPKAVFLLWPLLFLSISLGLFSPYRYASAFSIGTDNFQNEAMESTMTSDLTANVKDEKTQTGITTNVKNKVATESSLQHSVGLSQNNQREKRSHAKQNSTERIAGKAENSTSELKIQKISAEENKEENVSSDQGSTAEQSRFIIEPFDKLDLLEMDALLGKPYKAKKLKRIIRPKPKQVALSLGISGGAVIQQHLQAFTTEFDILDKQKQTDTGRELTGIQIGIAYPLSNKFYLKTGLSYTRAATCLALSELRYSRVQVEGVNGVWEDNQGNVHQVEGPVHATRKINYQTSWTSYHHMLDIPLSVGFRLLHYKRNLISIEAGATYHLMHKFQGAVWDAEFYLNRDESVSDNFKHRNFSARAALEWEYRFSTSYSLFAGVQATDILLKNEGIDLITEKKLYLINGILGVKVYPGNM